MDTEKLIDEYLNNDDQVMCDLELGSSITALVHILIMKGLTTEDEFCELRNKYMDIHIQQVRTNVLNKIGNGDEA